MQVIRILPPRYEPRATLNLSARKGVVVGLAAGSLLLFVVASWLMLFALPILRTDMPGVGFALGGLPDLLVSLVASLGLMAVMVVLHETIHGFGFWYYTGDRPDLAFVAPTPMQQRQNGICPVSRASSSP